MSQQAQSIPYLSMFFEFYEQTPPLGWLPRYGNVLENASEDYPELLEYLTKSENAWKVKSEAEWQALRQGEPWSGTGGVPYFVVDAAANTIRLPDTRGMYAEDAGFDGMDVGGVHGDATRRVQGSFGVYSVSNVNLGPTGAISANRASSTTRNGSSAEMWGVHTFDNANVMPTANKVQPRAYGMLPCVYVAGAALNPGEEPEPGPEYPEDGPGWKNITLAGTSGDDVFGDVMATPDGYIACGNYSGSAGGGLICKYTKELAFESKHGWKGGSHATMIKDHCCPAKPSTVIS